MPPARILRNCEIEGEDGSAQTAGAAQQARSTASVALRRSGVKRLIGTSHELGAKGALGIGKSTEFDGRAPQRTHAALGKCRSLREALTHGGVMTRILILAGALLALTLFRKVLPFLIARLFG